MNRNDGKLLYWGNKEQSYLAFIVNKQYGTIKCFNCKKTLSAIGFNFRWHGNKHCVRKEK